MSGIGSQHNKFNTCYGCPDRTAEPNCHETCRGYLYRQAEGEKQKKERHKDFQYYEYREELMKKKGKKFER